MKSLLLLLSILLINGIAIAQLTANGNSGASTTAYTNGAPNDQIYIWCADGLLNNTASLTATPTSGTGPFTFDWYYHNEATSSWVSYSSSSGATSTINNLPSDGYRVQIYDNGGNLVGCYIAWVWNMNSEVTANQTPSACDATNLNGAISVNGSFTYYNPPPPESLIDANTVVTVCFTANHTYVSDLAFYLVGPASCGSPTVLLSPNPGANGQGPVCNANNNVNNLCFTTATAPNFDPCDENCCGFLCLDVTGCTSNYTGTYSSYGPGNTPINWSPLYGCNAAQGGWSVQIYDCIGLDVGALTNANISFSNLATSCGSPSTINYSSGAINSAINDNSCSAATASIFQVPVSPNLTTPITINASTSYLWTSNPVVTIPNASTSLTPSATGLPTGNTMFYLTATIGYSGVNCMNIDSTSFTNTCCSVTADAGNDYSFCSNGVAQLGTPAVPGMTYSWSPATNLDDPNMAQPTATIGTVGATTYTLTVTNVIEGGCQDTDDVTITITAAPVLNITNDLTICPGDCANLAVAGADYYQWAASPDILDPTLSDQSVCPATTTTYNVTGYSAGTSVVSNGDFSAGAVDFTSDYVLNPDTQSEGTYFVTTNANFTHPAFVGVDHTTGTGNFLIVNGSGTPNSSVWCQTIQVQPNTDYIFSTWVSTLAVGSPAELQFSINGVNLSTPFIAPAFTGVWDEFFTTWNSGANTSATICIVNQNVSVGGNDFGIDDINFSPICTSIESVTVTVNPLPIVDAGANQTVCEGTAPITLVGSPAGGTYSGTGMTGNDFDPALGTQTITYDYTDGNGCSNSDQVTITVEPTPIVDAGNYGPVCTNDADVVLVGSPAGGTFSGNGVTGNAFDPSSGTQTITYNYTSPAGCSNSANTVITVNPLPVVDAGTYSAVCVDAANVNLVGNPAGGVFSGAGVIGNQFSPASGTQTITYTYTDGNGCTNTDNTTITVNNLPVINAGADQTICEGDEVTLNGSGGISYSWSNGAINGQPLAPGLGQTDYTVTGTDANGCTNTDVVSIITVPVPVSDITASSESGLPSLTVDFYNNSDMATSYFWNFGDGTTGTTTDLSTQNNTFDEPGTYWVILTASNGICSDYDTIQIIVMEHPAPIINIPNVFTPNGDNSNDVFFIDAQNVVSIEYIIVNRWNNLMFEGSGINPIWDGTSPAGKPAEDGVYFVKYEIVGINGDVISGHGHVTIAR